MILGNVLYNVLYGTMYSAHDQLISINQRLDLVLKCAIGDTFLMAELTSGKVLISILSFKVLQIDSPKKFAHGTLKTVEITTHHQTQETQKKMNSLPRL